MELIQKIEGLDAPVIKYSSWTKELRITVGLKWCI